MGDEPKKSILIRFRGSELDAKRLAALARHHERSQADVMRRLIAEETRRIRGDRSDG